MIITPILFGSALHYYLIYNKFNLDYYVKNKPNKKFSIKEAISGALIAAFFGIGLSFFSNLWNLILITAFVSELNLGVSSFFVIPTINYYFYIHILKLKTFYKESAEFFALYCSLVFIDNIILMLVYFSTKSFFAMVMINALSFLMKIINDILENITSESDVVEYPIEFHKDCIHR